MKKNGFVFIETIIAVVVLASSLVLLYSTFTKILQSEKARVYYDDVNYIYRNWYIKERINNLNIMAVLREFASNNNSFFVTVGIEYQDLFENYENELQYISKLLNDFEVNQMIIIPENKLDNLKSCSLECYLDQSCDNVDVCNNLYTNLSEEMINYLKTIYVDVSCTYILVNEYITCGKDNTNCQKYYSWVSV